MSEERITRAGLAIGKVPRVVGVATTLSTVECFRQQSSPPSDVLEMRLDRMLAQAETGWEDAIRAVEAMGVPVIGTVRLAAEGGAWVMPDEDRWPVIETALRLCSCVDVEYRSSLLAQTVAAANNCGTVVIASYHDFDHTPPAKELEEITARLGGLEGPLVVKIAAQVANASDLDVLRNFLHAYEGRHPLCLIGMGEAGVETRVTFPQQGSCLTYGHLDESTAPGQLSCQELMTKCRIQKR